MVKHKKLTLKERRARDAKKREAKKKKWIMSHMSSVLGRLKSAKEEKPDKLKPHAAAPWHKPVQEEAMVQKDDVSDELDEFEKNWELSLPCKTEKRSSRSKQRSKQR